MPTKRRVPPHAIDGDLAWSFVLEVRRHARAGGTFPGRYGLGLNPRDMPSMVSPGGATAMVAADSSGAWTARTDVTPEAARIFDLYLPLCRASEDRPQAVAHLGQSLDGRIATEAGASHYVTGPENIEHLHRMRALFDAVVVGASTVHADDPRLTTRRVSGDNPVRVVLDPARRLGAEYRVFHDGAAPTLLACTPERARSAGEPPGSAEVVAIPAIDGIMDASAILRELYRRGLHGVFVEGGGVTVSRFLDRGALDRLHLTVAPLILGSGRPSISLPVIDTLADGLRPRIRSFEMGGDILFDCDLRG